MLEEWLADNTHAWPRTHALHAASPLSPDLDADARQPLCRLQSGGHG